jgi:hypothetical protein
MPAPRNSYTFKEGLTMMAAKAVGIDPYMAAEAGENARATINAIRNAGKAKQPKDRAGYIREAQNELRTISATQHPKLVNALQTKLLALQGRGGDTAVAHVAPGEVVLPRSLQTPELMRQIAALAARQGIDPRQLTVGHRANNVNPRTGQREFLTPPLFTQIGPTSVIDPNDPNHVIITVPRGDGTGDGLGEGNGTGGGQSPGNGNGNGTGNGNSTNGSLPNLNVPGNGNQNFGPKPTDWSNRNDPFGVFRGYNNTGMPMGRSFVKYQEDVGFAERQNDYIRSIGIDPDNMTPADHERFYNAVDAGTFDPHKPAFWAHRWQYNGATDPAVIGNRAMQDYFANTDKRNSSAQLSRTAMVQALNSMLLKNPKISLKSAKDGDPNDLAMIQDIHPDDFNKGIVASETVQGLYKDHGRVDPEYYLSPNGTVHLRTSDVRTNPNPLSSFLTTVRRDQDFVPAQSIDDLTPIGRAF